MTVSSADDLRAKIREIPDFPKPGILFYDITTLLKDPDAFREVIDQMTDQVKDSAIDLVVGMESRGFIFSAPLAYQLHAGFVPVRKLGKLPAETIEVEYDLEYGTATLEIHKDAIKAGQRVLIVDDPLATGGTVQGTIELVQRLGGEIAGLSFMVELTGLHGREQLGDMFEFGEILALQRVGDRNRRDRHTGGVACEHEQRVIDRIRREDHHRPLGRESAPEQRGGERIDAAARVFIGELAPGIAAPFGEKDAARLRLDGRTEQPREARIVCAERRRAGEADRAVRFGGAPHLRRRERDRPVRGARRRAGMLIHRAYSSCR